MRLRIAAAAEADLESIADWIGKDYPQRALSFVLELREACAPLELMPEAFPVVPRFAHHAIRRKVHGSYLIFYVVTGDTVTVLRILHGARDYDDLLWEAVKA